MTIFAVIGWGLLILSVLNYFAFSRHMARRAESLAEYIECLFQNRAVYHDHRAKYADLLGETHQYTRSHRATAIQNIQRRD